MGKKDINDVYLGKDNYLLEIYSTIDYQEKLTSTINKLHTNNPDINMNIMLIPTKISIYNNKLPNNAHFENQQQLIDNIYSNLDTDIKTISIYNTLIQERNNYQLYYKTDHHWTTYGAYFGYQELAKANDINYIDINDFDIKTVTNSFKGSTYSKVVDPFSENENIDIFNYQKYNINVEYVLSKEQTNSLYNYDYLDKKDKYAMFLDNNHPLIKITNNDLNNDDNILIIKDSYANSMVPFLTNHYKQIYIIDPRYYKKSITKYIEENDIQNILILYNVGTLSTDSNILSIR